MDIYIVQPGDTIYSIANKYDVTVIKLIQDNGLINPTSLVPGQAIIITHPIQIHIVQQGDTVTRIANAYDISLMQLFRNNSFLSDRDYIYPNETLVISYNTAGKVTLNGYAYPYINSQTLKKTLPYLTYLSVFNYRVSKAGEIITYSDDAEVIQIAKDYGVAPLLMLSSISPQGEPNIEVVYEILLNKEYHDRLIYNFIKILKSAGYYGVNLMISGMNFINQNLYIDFLTDVSMILSKEGFQFFITINPNMNYVDNSFDKLDYSRISNVVNGITFFQYIWGSTYEPPSPVTSIPSLQSLMEYVITLAPPEKIALMIPLLGYDWELPYIPNKTYAHSLTLDSVIALANDVGATIQFDQKSQTPFFRYIYSDISGPIEHIVWFIDARSMDALDKIITEHGLIGAGIWNIMIYFQQVWTLFNSQYEITKIIPDNDN